MLLLCFTIFINSFCLYSNSYCFTLRSIDNLFFSLLLISGFSILTCIAAISDLSAFISFSRLVTSFGLNQLVNVSHVLNVFLESSRSFISSSNSTIFSKAFLTGGSNANLAILSLYSLVAVSTFSAYPL